MVISCFVPRCSPKTRKGREVSFHHLPVKDLERCKQWLRAINHPKYGEDTDAVNLKNLRVCSLHFKLEDWELNVLGMKRTALKDTAIPSIFTFPDDEQPRPSDIKHIRQEIKDNSLLVISGQLSGINSMTLQTPEGIQAKNESDRQEAKTTIDIGAAFPLWQTYREKNGFRTDTELAFYLLKRVRGEELSARSKKRRLETLTDVLALQKVESEKNSSQSSQDHQSTDKDEDTEAAEICYEVPFPSQTDESAQTELESEDQMLEDGQGFEDQIISEVQIKSEDQLEDDVSNDSVAPALDSEDIDPQISTSPTKKEIKKEPAETEVPPDNRLEVGINSVATSDKICHSFVQTANPVALKEEHTDEPLVPKKTHLTGLFRT